MKTILKNYLREIGTKGSKDLASKIGVNYLTLYHIAAGRHKPSAELAIKIFEETNYRVCFRSLVGEERAESIWPKRIFSESLKTNDIRESYAGKDNNRL